MPALAPLGAGKASASRGSYGVMLTVPLVLVTPGACGLSAGRKVLRGNTASRAKMTAPALAVLTVNGRGLVGLNQHGAACAGYALVLPRR